MRRRFFEADDDAFDLYACRRHAQFLVKPGVFKEREAVFFEDFCAIRQADAGEEVVGWGHGQSPGLAR